MSNEATGVNALADRYAVALFDLARERDVLDRTSADLDAIQAMLDASADLRRLVASPVLSRGEQGRAIAAVLDRAETSGLTRNFVGLLARNRRLFVIGDVIRAFRRRLANHRGEVGAVAISAKKLTARQLEALTEMLRETVGGTIVIDARVDKTLLGGLVVKVGSRMIDGSLSAKLQSLKLAMKGAG